MARPVGTKIDFYKTEFTSWDILNTALSYEATLEECAALLEVSEHTVINRINEEFGVSFSEYAKRFKMKNLVKFRQELHKMACSGKHPSVTIFYAKNKLGMSDKVDVSSEGAPLAITLNYKTDKEKAQ